MRGKISKWNEDYLLPNTLHILYRSDETKAKYNTEWCLGCLQLWPYPTPSQHQHQSGLWMYTSPLSRWKLGLCGLRTGVK
jgi:hypothetical protein